MALSDRILVMNLGVVQQVGTPLEVYQRPANRFVFGFIGLSNFLDVSVPGRGAGARGRDGLPAGAAPAELKAAGRAVLASRPSEIDFAAEGGVRGVVTRCAYLGEIIDYRIDVGGQEDARAEEPARARPPRGGGLRPRVLHATDWYGHEE